MNHLINNKNCTNIFLPMKKTIIKISILCTFTMTAISCQKETFTGQTNTPLEILNENTINLCYTVDGTKHFFTIHNNGEWDTFWELVIALAHDGHNVQVMNERSISIDLSTKETLVYTTQNEQEATEWMKARVLEGYKVSFIFDEETGKYTCIAVR